VRSTVVELPRPLFKKTLADRFADCHCRDSQRRRVATPAHVSGACLFVQQGNFPHGIAINTTADYFSLGNRVSAYTTVAYDIAQ